MKVAVVIPIYKKSLEEDEVFSLKTCIRLLSKYSLYFVGPKSIQNYVPQIYGDSPFVGFNDTFFESIEGYNQLMLSWKFYKKFESYDYILIYQLDALVFQDNLGKWLYSDIDYVGAPWTDFSRIKKARESIMSSQYFGIKVLKKIFLDENRISYAGNGGLSLRKVNSFLHISKKYRYFIDNWKLNEDYFWSIFVPMLEKKFVIPKYDDCKYFSIENSPEKFFEGIDKHFGCHAWGKNRPFWESVLAG